MRQSIIKTAYSCNKSPESVAAELYDGLYEENLACAVFFCSAEYDLPALSKALLSYFGDITLVGCTSAGEISLTGYTEGTVTGFAFPSKYFSVETALIENLFAFSFSEAQTLIADLLNSLEGHLIAPLEGNSFVFSLLDGLSIREELVLNALDSALGDIPLVGGSAGDDLHFKDTYVFYNGKFYNNAAVIVAVNTCCPFKAFSSHHLEVGNEKLVVTRANPESRIVYELNAEPAALEYSRVIGIPLKEIDIQSFAHNPIGVNINDKCFIRSIQKINDDLSLTFYCAIDEGIVFTTCKPGEIISHLEKLLTDIEASIGKPEVIIGFDCVMRRVEAMHLGLFDKMSSLFRKYRVIGSDTYGEHLHSMHLNYTFTGVAVGGPAPR